MLNRLLQEGKVFQQARSKHQVYSTKGGDTHTANGSPSKETNYAWGLGIQVGQQINGTSFIQAAGGNTITGTLKYLSTRALRAEPGSVAQ